MRSGITYAAITALGIVWFLLDSWVGSRAVARWAHHRGGLSPSAQRDASPRAILLGPSAAAVQHRGLGYARCPHAARGASRTALDAGGLWKRRRGPPLRSIVACRLRVHPDVSHRTPQTRRPARHISWPPQRCLEPGFGAKTKHAPEERCRSGRGGRPARRCT